MAENTIVKSTNTLNRTLGNSTDLNKNKISNDSNKFHVIAKKKLEKIKSKLAEFFFLNINNNNNSHNNNVLNNNIIVTTDSQNLVDNSHTANSLPIATADTRNSLVCNSISSNNNIYKISSDDYVFSNYYYGYKSNQLNEIADDRKIIKKTQIESINDYVPTLIADDDELQENLFDKNFMIDYISSQIIRHLKESNLLQSLNLDLRLPTDFNLLNEIAYDIYQQSENEPCGLKGCKLTIEIAINESLNKQIEKHEYKLAQQQHQQLQQHNSNSNNNNRSLTWGYHYNSQYQLPLTRSLTNFRFDQSSTLTTFELKLVIKEDLNSSFWLRKILPKSKLFDKLRLQNAIYLGSSYDLIKRKLY